MFDFLNKLGLPAKYAILFGVFAPGAMFLLNYRDPAAFGLANYLFFLVFGAFCGFGAGYMRQVRGKDK
ncbi:hypothetical protein ACKTEK_03755 [Tepidamorphus sp. 3E244]|uniref:hypothetical protein n=1 Tax=Tepidamorphus sp. 3E244 TaxID=3385498 RepID=UPI0038FC60B8